MNLDIYSLKRKIEDYFLNITKEELKRDLGRAKSEIYSNTEISFLEIEDEEIQVKTTDIIELPYEANSFYLVQYDPFGRNIVVTEAFEEIVRPRYPSITINVGSSNQESNPIGTIRAKKTKLQSATEDSLPGGYQYGYI